MPSDEIHPLRSVGTAPVRWTRSALTSAFLAIAAVAPAASIAAEPDSSQEGGGSPGQVVDPNTRQPDIRSGRRDRSALRHRPRVDRWFAGRGPARERARRRSGGSCGSVRRAADARAEWSGGGAGEAARGVAPGRPRHRDFRSSLHRAHPIARRSWPYRPSTWVPSRVQRPDHGDRPGRWSPRPISRRASQSDRRPKPARVETADAEAAETAPAASTANYDEASRRPKASGGRIHIVRPGESLWTIAEDLLGSDASATSIAAEVARLWELNRDRIPSGDPDLIAVGQRLRLR